MLSTATMQIMSIGHSSKKSRATTLHGNFPSILGPEHIPDIPSCTPFVYLAKDLAPLPLPAFIFSQSQFSFACHPPLNFVWILDSGHVRSAHLGRDPNPPLSLCNSPPKTYPEQRHTAGGFRHPYAIPAVSVALGLSYDWGLGFRRSHSGFGFRIWTYALAQGWHGIRGLSLEFRVTLHRAFQGLSEPDLKSAAVSNSPIQAPWFLSNFHKPASVEKCWTPAATFIFECWLLARDHQQGELLAALITP